MKKILFYLFFLSSIVFADSCPSGQYPAYLSHTYQLKTVFGNGTYYSNGYLFREKIVDMWRQNGDSGPMRYNASVLSYVCKTIEAGSPLDTTYQDNDKEICAVINGSLVCKSKDDNGNFDDNGNLTCNDNYSVVGVSTNTDQCMPNPENGKYDDNADLVCNPGYYNSSGTCLIDPSYTGNDVQNVDGYDYDIKDGDYFNKSPVTGLIEAVENSDGYEKDENGYYYPKCNSGYVNSTTIIVSGGQDGYTGQSCVPASGGNSTDIDSSNTGSDNGTGSTDTGSSGTGSTGGTDTGSSGTGSSGTGSTGTGSTGGTDTGSSGSSGGTGTSTGGGGTGTDSGVGGDIGAGDGSDVGNNPDVGDGTTGTDTGTGETPSNTDGTADDCNDTNMTLQEKTLCLLNTNLVTKLNAVSTKIAGSNTYLKNVDTNINSLNDKLTDSETGSNYIETISDGISLLTGGTIEDDKKSEYGTSIQTNLNNTLNDTFSKYSNILGFGSDYALAPDSITVELFEVTYTILDFSILDSYVSIIRTLFLSLAYIYGLLFFLRGGK